MSNFNRFAVNSQLVLPLSVEVFVPTDGSVRLLAGVLNRLDFAKQKLAYARRQRKMPFEVMLALVVYGYMRGERSTRRIEIACVENVNFMWLRSGYPAPDHNTIARFINDIDVGAVLVRVNEYLIAQGELTFEHCFVDGTKIEANANKYSFVWKGSVEKQQVKLQPKIVDFLSQVSARYEREFCEVQEVVWYLEQLGFERVQGKGSRKCQEQRDYEQAREYVEKIARYTQQIAMIGSSRKSMSKTDKDATFMRMKDDHMRNGTLKAAYNVQLCVESEYITSVYVSADRSDSGTLKPFLDKIEREYGKRHECVVADAGYETEENYVYLRDNKQLAYIKPTNHEQQKARKYKQAHGKKENMLYNATLDQYTCVAGRTLSAMYEKKEKTTTGYERTVTVYQCADCSNCSMRNLCTQAKQGNNKALQCSKLFEALRAESKANITTTYGTQLRVNRSIQVEGTFGIIKQDYDFIRFTRRSQIKVQKEFELVATAFNLNKLHSRIINNRLGVKLHDVLSEKATE